MISNVLPRQTRDHQPVFGAGSSFVNTRVPAVCGWSDTKLCLMMVTLEHGGNCSLTSPGGSCAAGKYGECGFSEGRILTYVSSDLSSSYWGTPVELLPMGPGTPARPKGTYSRPHLLFSHASATYTLWVAWRAPDAAPSDPGSLLVASCTGEACPSSAFTVLQERAPTALPTSGAAAALFVDSGASEAYLVHTVAASAGGGVVVERLAADWGSSAAAAEGEEGAAPAQRSQVLHLPGGDAVAGGECDSPSMFKRGGVYYVLFGARCCYCSGGTETHAFAALAPLGPYEYVGALGSAAVLGAQQDAILVHEDVEYVLWTGSVWKRDTLAAMGWGGLDYTPQHWAALDFYAGERPELPSIRPLVFHESFTCVVATP